MEESAPPRSGMRSAWDAWAGARALRWALVGLVALVAVVVSFAGVVEVCEEQLVQGSGEAVEVCRGPHVTDPGVLAFLLLLLVGLWPDVSQVSIGVVSLTREVEEQTARTEEVRRDVQLLGVELRQTISQQVSQQVIVGTTAATEPRKVLTGPPPPPGVALEDLLAPVRDQRAYEDARIHDAWRLLEGLQVRPPRVAIVGAGIDRLLREVEGLGTHLEASYAVTGAAADSVRAVGTASVGHILAIAPTATVLPVAVLGANYQLAPTALSEGISAALRWQPDVLLVGLGGGVVPDAEQLLMDRSGAIAIVAPAGNENASSSAWPGIISGVTSVAALDASGERAPFSNYGTGVDLAAPGMAITSLVGVTSGRCDFGEVSGTSSSADIVAGVAALLVGTGRASPSEILGVMRGAAGRSTTEGLAVLDAAAAADRLRGE